MFCSHTLYRVGMPTLRYSPAVGPCAPYGFIDTNGLNDGFTGHAHAFVPRPKTGPNKMADGEARKAMFAGHFANMGKLAGEKKLLLAGPLDGKEGRRGIFVFDTPGIATAQTWVATDPVSSAALMMVNEVHRKIEKK